MKEDIIREIIDDLEHGIEIGNIIFQMPEDAYIITTLKLALEKQISVKLNLNDNGICECPNCKTIYSYIQYCKGCGQKLDMNSVI